MVLDAVVRPISNLMHTSLAKKVRCSPTCSRSRYAVGSAISTPISSIISWSRNCRCDFRTLIKTGLPFPALLSALLGSVILFEHFFGDETPISHFLFLVELLQEFVLQLWPNLLLFAHRLRVYGTQIINLRV